MNIRLTLFLSIFLLSTSISNAQKFTFGIENGINYSNIRKKLDYERFESQPGPVNGIFAKYEVGKWFVLQSGVNHTSIYFHETQYQNYYYDYWMYSSSSYYPVSSSSLSIAPPHYSTQSTNKYSFLRIPLLVKFRTPGRLNFEIGGGYYYAFLTNDEFRGEDKDRFDKEYREENFPDMTDWGWILESSVNYNINQQWSIFASGKINYGKEEYFENVEGKIGSTELTFGIGYKPFTKQKEFVTNDSLGHGIQILPYTGMNISRVKSNKNDEEYSSSVSFATGVSLKFLLAKNLSLMSGAWYERKGYSLNYPGHYKAIYYVPYNDYSNTKIKSDVHLDYLTIPLLFNLSFGKKIRSNLELGSYFSLLQNAFSEGERVTTYQNEESYSTTKEYFNESLDLWFKGSDVGFIFAYRIEYPIFKWASIFASVNRSLGITNIVESSEELKDSYSFIDELKLKNRSTAIHFGLTLPVNKN